MIYILTPVVTTFTEITCKKDFLRAPRVPCGCILKYERHDQPGHQQAADKESDYGNQRRQLKMGQPGYGVARGTAFAVAGAKPYQKAADNGQDHSLYIAEIEQVDRQEAITLGIGNAKILLQVSDSLWIDIGRAGSEQELGRQKATHHRIGQKAHQRASRAAWAFWSAEPGASGGGDRR